MENITNETGLESVIKLKRGLSELSSDYLLSNVTVHQLTQQSNVARSTFYRHFNNLTDLITKYKSDLIIAVKDEIICDEEGYYYNPAISLTKTLEYIKSHQSDFLMMLNNDDDGYFAEMFSNLITLVLMMQAPIEDKIIKCNYQYFHAAYSAIITKWILNDCIQPVHSMQALISRLHQPFAQNDYDPNRIHLINVI